MDYPRPLQKKLLILAVGVMLASCSDINRDTFEIEYTTDDNPHTVELYHQGEKQGDRNWHRLYGLTFPQLYYAYRDNHDSLKQSAIGLLLDRETLRPLTEVIASETGVTETLNTPRFREGKLKRINYLKYRGRECFLLLSGNTPVSKVDVSIEKSRENYSQWLDFVEDSNGIAIYRYRTKHNNDDGGLPDIYAFDLRFPALTYRCSGGTPYCSAMFPYRGSAAVFTFPRNQLLDAYDLAKQIMRLLDRHVIP